MDIINLARFAQRARSVRKTPIRFNVNTDEECRLLIVHNDPKHKKNVEFIIKFYRDYFRKQRESISIYEEHESTPIENLRLWYDIVLYVVYVEPDKHLNDTINPFIYEMTTKICKHILLLYIGNKEDADVIRTDAAKRNWQWFRPVHILNTHTISPSKRYYQYISKHNLDRMCTSTDRFMVNRWITFVEENYSKCIDMSRFKIHKINRSNLDKWLKCMQRNKSDTVKRNAKKIYDAIQRIPFKEVMTAIDTVIKWYIDKYNISEIVMYIPEHIHKSNLWITVIVSYIFMHKYGITIKHLVTHQYRPNRQFNIPIVFCDDMIYEGKQFATDYSRVLRGLLNTKTPLLLCVPFVSSYWMYNIWPTSYISTSTVTFSDNTQVVPSLTHIINNDTEYMEMYNILNKPNILRPWHTVAYFDHKIADFSSVAHAILPRGYCNKEGNAGGYVGDIVDGCKAYNAQNVCFDPFYRGINYTLNGISILENTSNIFN